MQTCINRPFEILCLALVILVSVHFQCGGPRTTPSDQELWFNTTGDLTSNEPLPSVINFGYKTKTMSTTTIAQLELCDNAGNLIVKLGERIFTVSAGQQGASSFPWSGRRYALDGFGGRTLPVPPGTIYLRLRLVGQPDIQSGLKAFFVNQNSYDRDGDGISDAVEDENNGVNGETQTQIIDEYGSTRYGWFRYDSRDYPPSISTFISPSNPLYPNRGTHDHSIAGGSVSNGTLYNGLRYANQSYGYYDKNEGDLCWSDQGNYGTLELMNFLERVGRKWNQLHPYPPGPRMGLGDASLQYGGDYTDCHGNHHMQHQNGLEVDVRYIRNNQTEGPVDFNDPSTNIYYSRTMTQELVNLFIGLAPLGGVTILSADQQLQGIEYRADHTNHMHVWIVADPDGTGN
jgi:hypothetical protein